MKIHAVVPVKALKRAKSRLATVLSTVERHDLVLDMLSRVLGVLNGSRVLSHHPAGVPGINGEARCARSPDEIWVISDDTEVLDLATGHGALTMPDGTGSLNGALDKARGLLSVARVDGMLIIPADIPLINQSDVAALSRALKRGADVVISPDAAGVGTNALGMRLPCILPLTFGERSLGRHLAGAANLGLRATLYRSPRIALDVDDPPSLARYRAQRTTA